MINQIRFLKPESLNQACELLANEPQSMAVAGGTDLIVKVRNGMYPELKAFVDISSLPLNEIRDSGKFIEIGSGCTMTSVVENELLQKNYPALVKAASTVGALQIRNLATIGGNSANASPAGDTIPALVSLETIVKIHGPAGCRELPLEKFFLAPGKNALERGEIVEAFLIPKRATKGAFMKLGERKAHAISKINLAFSTWQDGNKTICRIAMGSVAPTVIRVPEAESLIETNGLPLSDSLLNQAAELATKAARPISDVRSTKAYRKQMAGILLKRALKEIC
jgi:CO/xanthine dehydrogenase FAD-binding subunit